MAHAQPSETIYYVIWTIEGVCLVSVNCYMMITGYFGWKTRFRWKRLICLYTEIWLYTILLTLIALAPGLEGQGSISEKLLPVVGGSNWYVTAYFAVCVLSPVLNSAVRILSGGERYHED